MSYSLNKEVPGLVAYQGNYKPGQNIETKGKTVVRPARKTSLSLLTQGHAAGSQASHSTEATFSSNASGV
jgi:hypothetical protein